jgi:hypothetical protein
MRSLYADTNYAPYQDNLNAAGVCSLGGRTMAKWPVIPAEARWYLSHGRSLGGPATALSVACLGRDDRFFRLGRRARYRLLQRHVQFGKYGETPNFGIAFARPLQAPQSS